MRFRETIWMYFAPRILIVCKGGIGSDEYIISHAKTIPQLNAALDRNPISNYDIVLNENMRTDITVGSDSCPGKHDHKLPDPCAIANGIGSDIRKFVNDGFDLKVVQFVKLH